MWTIGKWLYGPEEVQWVQRVPFAIHLYTSPSKRRCCGRLKPRYYLLSYDTPKRGKFSTFVSSNTTPYLFSDTLGGPMYDHLIPNRIGGPFNTELDLHTYMYSEVGEGQSLAEIYDGEENIPHGYQSVFTHSDLHYSNLLVDQGRFCGIIDWECAGFKSEYWEFTHASLGVWGNKYEMSLLQRILGNQYDRILEKEEIRWRCDPIF
ncbi:hypothetical protein EAF00_009874 [Botryotinia globosa]|nr:hypothetical protein EAF00_009874 [Botryotinia globosa]